MLLQITGPRHVPLAAWSLHYHAGRALWKVWCWSAPRSRGLLANARAGQALQLRPLLPARPRVGHRGLPAGQRRCHPEAGPVQVGGTAALSGIPMTTRLARP
jgi:hypothetical protein